MENTVTITRAEYDRLRLAAEELDELQAYDGVQADLASGADELIPADFAKRMIGGESPVRVYRELRKMNQSRLADSAGVNRVQLIDIEAGRKNGSVETLRKLANALGVTIDDLI
jgi:mRNA interferase RelE/StbE